MSFIVFQSSLAMTRFETSPEKTMAEEGGSPVGMGSDNEVEDGWVDTQAFQYKISSMESLPTAYSAGQQMEETDPYTEPGRKEGHVLFLSMRKDIEKALHTALGPNKPKAEAYLDRVTFIGRQMVAMWFGTEISAAKFNHITDLLRDRVYMLTFPVLLEAFRRLNYLQLDIRGLEHFGELVNSVLSQVTAPANLVCQSAHSGHPTNLPQYEQYLLCA